jgi:hypothetical protein
MRGYVAVVCCGVYVRLAVGETSDALNCALLDYYAPSSGNSLPTSRRVIAQKSTVLIYFAAEA